MQDEASRNTHMVSVSCRSHTPLAPHPTLDFPSTSAAGPAAVKSEPIVVRDYKGEMSGIPLPEPSHTRQGGSYTPRISTRSGQNGHKGDLPSGRKQSTRKSETSV